MKVLEFGKFTDQWNIKHRCTGSGNGGNGCEALLEVEKSDLRHYPSRDTGSWGDCDEAVLFKCPICDTLTDLAKKDWPKLVRDLIPYSDAWKNGTQGHPKD